jgi:hypothetical protein
VPGEQTTPLVQKLPLGDVGHDRTVACTGL